MKPDNCTSDLMFVRRFVDEVWGNVIQDQYEVEEIDNGLLLLFLFTYSKWKKDQKCYDKAFELTGQIVEKLINKGSPIVYFHGITGVLAAIDQLVKNRLIDSSSYQNLSPMEESLIVKMGRKPQCEMDLLELTFTGHFLLQRFIVRKQKKLYRNNIHFVLLQLIDDLISRDLKEETYYCVCVIDSFLNSCNKQRILPQLIDDYSILKKEADSSLHFLDYNSIFCWHRKLKKGASLKEIEYYAENWTGDQFELSNSIKNKLLLSLICMNFCFDQNKAYQNYLLFK